VEVRLNNARLYAVRGNFSVLTGAEKLPRFLRLFRQGPSLEGGLCFSTR